MLASRDLLRRLEFDLRQAKEREEQMDKLLSDANRCLLAHEQAWFIG